MAQSACCAHLATVVGERRTSRNGTKVSVTVAVVLLAVSHLSHLMNADKVNLIHGDDNLTDCYVML